MGRPRLGDVMKGWRLVPRECSGSGAAGRVVDGSLIRVDALETYDWNNDGGGKDRGGNGAAAMLLPTPTGWVPLRDLFVVHVFEALPAGPRIVFDGDCPWLDRVGAARPGHADSGDVTFIHARGSLGAMVGHRMRRGTIWIDGNLGDWAGAMMIAGTLVAGGTIGRGAMVDAKRGSLICKNMPELAPERFTVGIRQSYPVAKLLAGALPEGAATAWLGEIAKQAKVCRGDLSLGGRAEVVSPLVCG
ncbi:MAG: hypothetical protein AAF958_02120 [Planctomycetota bacterium]